MGSVMSSEATKQPKPQTPGTSNFQGQDFRYQENPGHSGFQNSTFGSQNLQPSRNENIERQNFRSHNIGASRHPGFDDEAFRSQHSSFRDQTFSSRDFPTSTHSSFQGQHLGSRDFPTSTHSSFHDQQFGSRDFPTSTHSSFHDQHFGSRDFPPSTHPSFHEQNLSSRDLPTTTHSSFHDNSFRFQDLHSPTHSYFNDQTFSSSFPTSTHSSFREQNLSSRDFPTSTHAGNRGQAFRSQQPDRKFKTFGFQASKDTGLRGRDFSSQSAQPNRQPRFQPYPGFRPQRPGAQNRALEAQAFHSTKYPGIQDEAYITQQPSFQDEFGAYNQKGFQNQATKSTDSQMSVPQHPSFLYAEAPVVSQPLSVMGTVQLNCPKGLEYLSTLGHVFVQQRLDLIEAYVKREVPNKYTVVNRLGQPFYTVEEEVDTCGLCIGGGERPFEMCVRDIATDIEVIHISRPCTCCVQEVVVSCPSGGNMVLGFVKKHVTLVAPYYEVLDDREQPVFKIEGPPLVGLQYGYDVDFKVKSLDGSDAIIGNILRQWPGFFQDWFTDADNFGVDFPIDLAVKMKALLLGATILIDYTLYED